MKTYEILSAQSDKNSLAYQYGDGVASNLVAVVTIEAISDADARNKTAHFCNMMDITVHSVREVK